MNYGILRHNIICDLKTCIECRSRHGQIYGIDEVVDPAPPLHNNCRCDIVPMESIEAGNATKNNNDGADYWLKHFGELPDYYLTKEELIQYGCSYGKKPAKFAPEKCILKEFTIMQTVICPMQPEEFGMKQI